MNDDDDIKAAKFKAILVYLLLMGVIALVLRATGNLHASNASGPIGALLFIVGVCAVIWWTD